MGYNLPLLKFSTATDEEKRDSTFNIRSIKYILIKEHSHKNNAVQKSLKWDRKELYKM